MKTKGIKKVTVDELARMTQDGFSRLEKSFKEHTKVVLEEFRRLNADIKDIKTTLARLWSLWPSRRSGFRILSLASAEWNAKLASHP